MDTSKVTRIEVIDHTGAPHLNTPGQEFNARKFGKIDPNMKLELSLQDDGKTLKVFLSERQP